MKLRNVSGCENGACPAVHVSDRGTLVFQGDAVTQAEGLNLGPGEQAVELPAEVFRQALEALAGIVILPDDDRRL
jgi:hypothetical protein